jgi:hypothetical protein
VWFASNALIPVAPAQQWLYANAIVGSKYCCGQQRKKREH